VDHRVRAVDLEGHGGRDPLHREPRRQRMVVDQLQHDPRRESGGQRVPQRVQARDGQPPGQQRVGRVEPGRIIRLLRSGHRHRAVANLPRVPQWQQGRGQSRRVHERVDHLGQRDDRRAARGTESQSDRSGRRSRWQPDSAQSGTGARLPPRTSLS
jgi:hypothetical protein